MAWHVGCAHGAFPSTTAACLPPPLTPVTHAPLCRPRAGGYYVWGSQTAVNYQIVLYLLSRVVVAIIKVLASRKIAPFALVSESQVGEGAGIWV